MLRRIGGDDVLRPQAPLIQDRRLEQGEIDQPVGACHRLAPAGNPFIVTLPGARAVRRKPDGKNQNTRAHQLGPFILRGAKGGASAAPSADAGGGRGASPKDASELPASSAKRLAFEATDAETDGLLPPLAEAAADSERGREGGESSDAAAVDLSSAEDGEGSAAPSHSSSPKLKSQPRYPQPPRGRNASFFD